MPVCNCGFDIPAGGTLTSLQLTNPLSVSSGGTGASGGATSRRNLGIDNGCVSDITGLSSSSPLDVSISFGADFVDAPDLVVTPQTSASATGNYGIFFYIKSITASGATVRLTTNVSSSSSLGTLQLNWIAIGGVGE